jgi:hypothetical protein
MMLKKSLLAISLAAAVGTVNAGTLDAGGASSPALAASKPQAISTQSGVTQVALGTVTMNLGATALSNYTTLDKVKVTLSGGTLSAASSATIGGTAGVLVVTGGLTYPDASTILFDVSALSPAPAANSTITIGGLAVVTDGSSPVSMTIESISTVAGVVIDSASGVVAQYVNEYTAAVGTKADGEITFDRLTFTNTGSTGADSVVVAVSQNTVDIADTLSDGVAVSATLKGDLSFLDFDGDGKLGGAKDGSVNGTVAANLQSTTLTGTAMGNYTFTVTLPAAANKVAVPAQSFTADASVAYTNAANKAGSQAVSGLAAGSWVVDGTTKNLQFMPFGSQYANSVTVTNLSAIDGDVTVTITANGETTTPTVVGVAKAKSVSQFGKEIAAIAAANGISDGYVSLTVNADSVEVVGIYYAKADGDRVLTK